MERTTGMAVLFGLSASAILLGFALCFPFFSLLPLYWGIGLAGVFVLSFVASTALQRRMMLSGVYVVTGVIYSILFVWAVSTFVGVERLEEYECGWRTQSGRVEIDLRPVGGFGWSSVSSNELLEHVSKEQPAMVQVQVPITRDFGCVRARGAIKRVDGIPVQEF
jgi:hypothetical protein